MSFSNLTLLFTLALLISTLTAPSSAATFNCTTPTNSTCQSLIDFAPTNATTLNAVKTLFNITHLRTLLGANNLNLSTPPDQPVTANQKLRIPFSCRCFNGSGVSNRRPRYIVKAGDGLDYIASLFSRVVTYQEIARVNGIPDPDKIEIGQNLWIPLPCNCDKVDGEDVVHYGHVVDPGSTVLGIAEEYGTTEETLLRINGMPNSNELKAGQVLDVPLKACASSVLNGSIDSPLLVPNNTYVFTAFNCVKCQCSSANNWTLQCEPSYLNSTLWRTCPSMQCQDSNQLYIGNTTSSSSCNQTTCAYGGYNNQTILTDLVAQSTCSMILKKFQELMKMTATQFRGAAPSTGLRNRTSDYNSVTKKYRVCSLCQTEAKFVALSNRKDLSNVSAVGGSNLSSKHRSQYSRLVTHRRRTRFPVVANQLSSEFGVGCSEVEEKVMLKEMLAPLTADCDEPGLSDIPVPEAYSPNVKCELLMLSLPAIVGQAIDPIAMLMETAYIGRLGSVELASAGVSMNIFNYISKLFNIPLLSVATSFVAEDIAKSASKASTIENAYEDITNGKSVPAERKQLSSVSTALLLALGIGMFEALALSLGSGLFLNMMGISSNSPMHIPAKRFLIIRAFGAPAVVASLALQGVFRGFKDTTTPVLCLGIGNLLAAFLLPTLIYYFRLGVTGAAMSTVISQYTVTFLMIWFLNKKAVLLPPKMGSLQFGGYIKSGGFLLGRTLAVLTTMTLGTSMAARQGPVAMAAHQICIQVWLAVSLLTDALATSGQALIASYSSKGEYKIVKEITDFMLKIGLFIGVSLAVILGTSFGSIATLFTKDAAVLEILRSGVLFVSASQPLTSLAYVFDGLHYGVSDFAYAARAMMVVGAISSVFLLYAPSVIGLSGVWLGLTLFMGLRAVAGFVRLLSKSGPWWFLHRDTETSQLVTSGY